MESAQTEYEKCISELDAKILENRQVPPAISALSSGKIDFYVAQRDRLKRMRRRNFPGWWGIFVVPVLLFEIRQTLIALRLPDRLPPRLPKLFLLDPNMLRADIFCLWLAVAWFVKNIVVDVWIIRRDTSSLEQRVIEMPEPET